MAKNTGLIKTTTNVVKREPVTVSFCPEFRDDFELEAPARPEFSDIVHRYSWRDNSYRDGLRKIVGPKFFDTCWTLDVPKGSEPGYRDFMKKLQPHNAKAVAALSFIMYLYGPRYYQKDITYCQVEAAGLCENGTTVGAALEFGVFVRDTGADYFGEFSNPYNALVDSLYAEQGFIVRHGNVTRTTPRRAYEYIFGRYSYEEYSKRLPHCYRPRRTEADVIEHLKVIG